MRIKLFLICLSQLFIQCSVDRSQKNDLTLENIRGQVKTITEIAYEADDTLGYSFINLFAYDPKGNKIIYKTIQKDSSLWNTIIWTFNKAGQKIMEVERNVENENRINRINYYDDKGQLIEVRNIVQNDANVDSCKFVYRYDEEGNPVEKISYTFSKGDSSIRISKFDANGEITGSRRDKFIYDKNKHLIELWYYTLSGDSIKIVYLNDQYGNAIKAERYLNGVELIGSEEIYYQYDSLGNWIRKEVWEENKRLSLSKRTYEYYDSGEEAVVDYSNPDSILSNFTSKQIGIFKGKEIFLCVDYNEWLSEEGENRAYVKENYLKGYQILSPDFIRHQLFADSDSIIDPMSMIRVGPKDKIDLNSYLEEMDMYQRDTLLNTEHFTGIIYEEIRDLSSEKYLYTFDKNGKVISRLILDFYGFSGSYSTGDNNEKYPFYEGNAACIKNDFTISWSDGEYKFEYQIQTDGKIVGLNFAKYTNRPASEDESIGH